jgi:hypothetical protein
MHKLPCWLIIEAGALHKTWSEEQTLGTSSVGV